MTIFWEIARAAGVLVVVGLAATALAEPVLAAEAGEDGAVESERQCDVYIAGRATGGRGSVAYRWLDDGSPMAPWADLRADRSAPVELCGLPVGRHVLTLEVTDGTSTALDSLVATVKPAVPPGLASAEKALPTR